MLSLDELKTRIYKAQSIILICHISPDGDTIGSGLALYKFLKKIGKERVEIVCEDEANGKLGFLSDGIEIKKDLDDVETFDLAVGIDVATAERMGELRRFYYRAKDRVVIDHHRTNDFPSNDLYLVAKSSSAAEIMYSILMYFDKDVIDKSIAECLYAGILTDSGAFYFPSTTANTHFVLGKLYEYGIDANRIYFELFKKINKNVLSLHISILQKAVFEDNSQIAILSFHEKDFKDTNTTISDTEGCINKIQDVEGVIIAISIAEVAPNSYKVSFRSKGDHDVSVCATRFGGGGHKNAAGCRLNGSYYDVYDKVLHAAEAVL